MDIGFDSDATISPPRTNLLHLRGGSDNGRRKFDIVVVIGVGGALGTLARYGIATAFPVTSRQIPWATLAINLSGSFLLGFMLSVVERLPPNRFMRPFLAVGMLGGFTTFSTFAVEVVQLFRERPWITLSYLAASGGGGVLCALVGSMAVRGFYPRSLDRLSKGA